LDLASFDEDEIARRILAGDPQAEDLLIRKYQPGLMVMARFRVGEDDASDLVQETLSSGLRNLRRGDWNRQGALGAYLAGILRRQAPRIRSSRLGGTDALELEQVPSPNSGQQGGMERELSIRRVHRALDRLSAPHREVLLSHYIDDQSVDEIASRLAIPRGTVLSRLHHARSKMAKILNRLGANRNPVIGWRRRGGSLAP
jgi:RNA polymerase sigma-70 factor (ECF subfamily)